eukprot:765328-Hanusia_phi.AAC.7
MCSPGNTRIVRSCFLSAESPIVAEAERVGESEDLEATFLPLNDCKQMKKKRAAEQATARCIGQISTPPQMQADCVNDRVLFQLQRASEEG